MELHSRFFSDVVVIRKGVEQPRIGDVVCAFNPRLGGGVLIKVRVTQYGV